MVQTISPRHLCVSSHTQPHFHSSSHHYRSHIQYHTTYIRPAFAFVGIYLSTVEVLITLLSECNNQICYFLRLQLTKAIRNYLTTNQQVTQNALYVTSKKNFIQNFFNEGHSHKVIFKSATI